MSVAFLSSLLQCAFYFVELLVSLLLTQTFYTIFTHSSDCMVIKLVDHRFFDQNMLSHNPLLKGKGSHDIIYHHHCSRSLYSAKTHTCICTSALSPPPPKPHCSYKQIWCSLLRYWPINLVIFYGPIKYNCELSVLHWTILFNVIKIKKHSKVVSWDLSYHHCC